MTNRDPRPEGESVHDTERYRIADNRLNGSALTRSGCRVAGSRTTTISLLPVLLPHQRMLPKYRPLIPVPARAESPL